MVSSKPKFYLLGALFCLLAALLLASSPVNADTPTTSGDSEDVIVDESEVGDGDVESVGMEDDGLLHVRARYPVLDQGDRGTDVKALQYLLRYRGFDPGSIDGVFGSGTRSKVIAFQNSRNLSPDGVVGPNTWQALFVTVRDSSPISDAVRAVQMLLNEKRFAGLSVDGDFGPATLSAVKSFQNDVSLGADGVVGANTWLNLVWHYERPAIGSSTNLCSHAQYSEQWGTGSMVGSLQRAGQLFAGQSAGRIHVRDISLEHGGDIAGHASHELGLDVDLRPIRTDRNQCSYGTQWNYSTYDRAKTRELIRDLIDGGNVRLIFFNDPVLVSEFSKVQSYPNHDDHLHVRYCEPGHSNASYRC